MRVLVTRPEPGASETAARLTALGHDVLNAPLLTVEPVPWTLPDRSPDAVVMTSANAARHGGTGLAALADLPLFAVGQATADAARSVRFVNVTTGNTGVEALLALAAGLGAKHALHLAGEDRIEALLPAGMTLEIVTVYRAAAANALPADTAAALAAGEVDICLLYSPRTARIFASLCPNPTRTAIAALSPAVLAAAGLGWHSAIAALEPNEAALLAAAGLTCEKLVSEG